MVKLIRMKADESGGTEIRNTFKEPIILKPNSRVALSGMDLKLASVGDNETFNITATDTMEVDGKTATLTVDEYNQSDLVAEVRRAMALSRTTSSHNGVDYQTEYVNGRFVMSKEVATFSEAEFVSDFYEIEGNPTIDDTGNYAGNSSACQLISSHTFGNATGRVTGSFLNTDDGEISVVESGGTVIQGVGINAAGKYTTTFKGTTTATAVSAAGSAPSPETFDMQRYGSTLKWTIKDSAGTEVVSRTETITAADWDTYFTGEGLYLQVSSPNGSAFNIGNVNISILSVTTITQLKITFATQILADYLGFSGLGPHTSRGLKAVVQGEHDMVGDEKYPGVLVTLSPTVLETHDGYKKSKFQDSILYVLHSTRSFGRQVAFDVPERIKLNLKNKNEINLNQLRVTFRDPEGGLLRYVGRPTVTLLIYDPEES